MQHTKALFLGALFAGMGTVTAINEIGIGIYPPSGQFPDGMTRGFHPSDVRACMGARALAAIGDRSSQRHWHQCATTLVQTQALSGFDLRYWGLLVAGVVGCRARDRCGLCCRAADHQAATLVLARSA